MKKEYSMMRRNLIFLRTKTRLSQQKFATLLNISKSKLGSIEEGRSKINVELLFKLSLHFNISMEKIYTTKITEYEKPERKT